MEYRQLGGSGLKVSALSFGTATFGGGDAFFSAWGNTDVDEARRLARSAWRQALRCLIRRISIPVVCRKRCLARRSRENGISCCFRQRRPSAWAMDRTNWALRAITRPAPVWIVCADEYGPYRYLHNARLRRAHPFEEMLRTLDTLVQSGKVRYIACSNFSGWHLMKSLATAQTYGWTRYVAHQAFYSLVWREYEWDLMRSTLTRTLADHLESLASGMLSGKILLQPNSCGG